MTFYEKVKSLCEIKGISITALVVELGYSGSTATTWKNSEGLPRAATIKKVADYFGISVAQIKADVDEPIDFDCIDTSEFDQPLWQHFLHKNENDEKRAIRAYLKFQKAQYIDAITCGDVQDNHGIIGPNHAPVTIVNGSEKKLSEQEIALIRIFEKLDVVKQAQLLAYAAELEKFGFDDQRFTITILSELFMFVIIVKLRNE